MIIGIDLGTTNSLASAWLDGAAKIIPNALGSPLTPSCVSLLDDGSLVVGAAAKDRLQSHPAQSAALFKRHMGSNKKVKLGSTFYRPEELSSFVLRALKADAEAFLNQTITEAIITVPAYFNDAQRKATRIAGELAGLRVERLLNEPTAAALAYGLQTSGEKKFLVFDLGGGTFDVSILELFEGIMEVRASAGDNFLGGEDFVSSLILHFLDKTGLSKKLGTKFDHIAPEIQQRLRSVAERAKCTLTDQPEASMRLDLEGAVHECTITQDQFQALSEPLLDRLRQPVERALRDARIMPSSLDHVVMAGGASRMPMVRRLVSRMFGRFPVVDLNPDELIALGAAVQAGLKMRDAALDEVVMTDVSPYTMGIEISRQLGPNHASHGHYQPIIERNCVVPVSKSTKVYTMVDFQKHVDVRIFQGESPMVSDNVFLGSLKVQVPARRAGEVELDIRFTYDINGLLEAETKVVETGAVHKLVIEENPGVMSPAEIQERLAALNAIKIHPREQAENRALLARAERMYQQLLGEPRNAIGHSIAAFQSVLERQHADEIRGAQKSMKQFLDELEEPSLF
jgi:molecular chaperone HscC